HLYYHPFAPLFSVALVDGRGRDVPLRQIDRHWTPARLRCRYTVEGQRDLVLIEDRIALPRGRFISRWSREDGKPLNEGALAGHHLVLFTAQNGPDILEAE